MLLITVDGAAVTSASLVRVSRGAPVAWAADQLTPRRPLLAALGMGLQPLTGLADLSLPQPEAFQPEGPEMY